MSKNLPNVGIVLAIFCCVGLLFPNSTRGDSLPDLYATAQAASVEVLTNGHLAGSGWFTSPQGLIFTAAHLIKGLPEIEIISPDAGRLPAFLVATDLAADLALLKVRRDGRYFPALPFASKLPAVGDELYLLGAPAYRHHVMIRGNLAKTGESYEWNVQNSGYVKVFTLQAMTPEGFSGAPWINNRGEVVGLQSGMLAWRGQLMGLAFASPIEAAKKLIRTKQSTSVATLGATFAEAWEVGNKDRMTPTGLKILQLLANSPLQHAGIEQGDFILKVNGQGVSSRDELLNLIRGEAPATEVALEIETQHGGIQKKRVSLGCLGLGCLITP